MYLLLPDLSQRVTFLTCYQQTQIEIFLMVYLIYYHNDHNVHSLSNNGQECRINDEGGREVWTKFCEWTLIECDVINHQHVHRPLRIHITL